MWQTCCFCTWGVNCSRSTVNALQGKCSQSVMTEILHLLLPVLRDVSWRHLRWRRLPCCALSHSIVFVTFLPDFVRTDETSQSFSITAWSEQYLVKKNSKIAVHFLVCSLNLWNWWTWALQVDSDKPTDDTLSQGRGHWHVIPTC